MLWSPSFNKSASHRNAKQVRQSRNTRSGLSSGPLAFLQNACLLNDLTTTGPTSSSNNSDLTTTGLTASLNSSDLRDALLHSMVYQIDSVVRDKNLKR